MTQPLRILTNQPIQTITQLTRTTNIVIPPQNTTIAITLNTTTQSQNTTTVLNIVNLISQQMETTTGVTVRGSNSQNNTTSNVNTGGEHFSYFGTIGANPFRRFKTFGGDNNNPPLGNSNNNNSLLLPLPEFGEGLRGGFNPLLGGNARGLDLNVAVLVNALAGVNLGMNHIERESNHIKLTEFREQR